MHNTKPNTVKIHGIPVSAHKNENDSISVYIGGNSNEERQGIINSIVVELNKKFPSNPVTYKLNRTNTYRLMQSPAFMLDVPMLTLDDINSAIGEVASVAQIGYDSGVRHSNQNVLPQSGEPRDGKASRIGDLLPAGQTFLDPAEREKAIRELVAGAYRRGGKDPFLR